MGLGLPWTMADGKVVLLQHCGPVVKERGPRPHHLKPLERIVVGKYLEWHSHEVRPELGYRPHDSQALQFSGRDASLNAALEPTSEFPPRCVPGHAVACPRVVRVPLATG